MAFSILERIDVGETCTPYRGYPSSTTFSILERIDVGETIVDDFLDLVLRLFQYPRTDRRG